LVGERELAAVKNSLYMRSDFNLADAFKMFGSDKKITVKNMRAGLDAIGVYPREEEINLFFQRYDSKRSNWLS
jgi:Ca2+-binding EF-hand superfamily protein